MNKRKNIINMSLLAAAAPVLTSVGERIYDSVETRNLMDKKYQEQRDLMRFQWEHDSPANQIKRLRAAGLNPDLAYSQLSAGASAPPLETDSIRGGSVAAAAGQGIRLKQEEEMKDSAIAVNDSVIQKNQADADLSSSRAQYFNRLRTLSYTKERLMESNISLNDARIDEMQQSIRESVSRVKVNDANIAWINSKKVEQDIYNQNMQDILDSEITKNYAAAAKDIALRDQVRQAISHAAKEFQQTYAMLCNERQLSDESLASSTAQLAEITYRSLEMQNLIVFDEKTKQWKLTSQGEKLKPVDATLWKVGNLVDFVTKNVGRFFSHRTFENKSDYHTEESIFDQYDESGSHWRTHKVDHSHR